MGVGHPEVQELWKHCWLKGDQLLRSSTIARFTHIGAQDEPVVFDEPQSDIHLTSPTAFARPRDNRSHAASEGRGRGSDLAVTAPERPRRWPGWPCGSPVPARATARKVGPGRDRADAELDAVRGLPSRTSFQHPSPPELDELASTWSVSGWQRTVAPSL